MAIESMWTSIAAWFTPSVLFCAANLIIATIYFASNNDNNNKHHEQLSANSVSRIGRVSSFLDRARSMRFPSATTITTTATVTTTAAAIAVESQYEYPSTPRKTANYSSSSRLAQSIYCASSNKVVLPEVSNGDGMYPPESETQPLSQTVHAPSLFERVKSIKFSSAFSAEPEQISDSSPQLVRAPSFLERVKSIRISSAFKSGAQPENFDNSEHHVIRSKSDKTTKPAKKSVVEMKKSRSEMRISKEDDDEDVYARLPATARESRHVADEEVDAKADDFITRFKQQLKLQRLESLVRYNEMLNRGN